MPRYRIETITVPESTAAEDRYVDLKDRRIIRVFSSDVNLAGQVRVMTEERIPNEDVR